MSWLKIFENYNWIIDYDKEQDKYRVRYFEDGYFVNKCVFDAYKEKEENTVQQQKEAIKYIEAQLENGYIDLGINEECELQIIKEAIQLLKSIDKWNSLGCTSFNNISLTEAEIKAITKRDN